MLFITSCNRNTVVHILVTDANGLNAGSEVKMNDSTVVGWVDKEDFYNDSCVLLNLKINKYYHIYRNTEISIGSENLLGKKYVNIKKSNGTIPLNETDTIRIDNRTLPPIKLRTSASDSIYLTDTLGKVIPNLVTGFKDEVDKFKR